MENAKTSARAGRNRIDGGRLDGSRRWPFGSLTDSHYLRAAAATDTIVWSPGFGDNRQPSSFRYIGDPRRFEHAALQSMRDSIRRAADAPVSLPLTVAQRGIWIGDKISRTGTVFSIAEAIEIHGRVEPEIFTAALRRVADEADATRTNIVEDGHGPRQVIRARYKSDLPFVDFSGGADPASDARAWMMRDVEAKLDLERDALWFSALLKLADDRYVWHHRAHHIIYDGYTGGIVAGRVAAVYDALLAGRDPGPTPFSPLKALVDAEHDYRSSGALARDGAYWRDRLADLPEPITLAPGRLPTANGLARETVRISPDDADRLQRLAKGFSCTRPQLLIALAAAFLHRSTGAVDLVLGMPVSARNKQTRMAPGMAANAIVLRIAVDPLAPWAALAAETAREAQRALRRQFYRFEDMRRDLGLTGQHQHVTRIAVNIEPFDYTLTIGGHRTSAHNLANSSVEDLVIFVYDRGDGGGLRVDFDANPSLYAPDVLKRHAARFERVMRSLLENPDGRIADIEFLAPDERADLIRIGEGPSRTEPFEPVLSAFERRAAQTPHAIALQTLSDAVTYADLDARAEALAVRLGALGVRTGDIVALALPKSVALVQSMLAVHKAGAAFLPLDPDEPRARLEKMAEAASFAAIVAFKSGRDQFGALAPLFVAADGENDLPAFAARPQIETRPADPAYVIFTSGSTGTPRGAVIPHEALVNAVASVREVSDFSADERYLSCVAHTFDPFMLEVFVPLTSGATVWLVPQADMRDPALVAEHMRRIGVTIMLATPALYEAIVASRAASLKGLKAMVGGEALTQRLARSLRDLGAIVINQYGPTEAGILCTTAPITDETASPPPIGRPIRNMRAYVVDAALNLLPYGMIGELCIAGPSVGLDYVGAAAGTGGFLDKDPFGSGARFYRTGDLVRWRENGDLEFHGRKDGQLKIRGYRIEPGEIEAALLDCEGVASAHAAGAVSPSGARRIVAYVARRPGASLDQDALRASLQKRLPDHMLPSSIVILDAIPLTRHGKIDRNALPKAEERQGAGYVPPRTEAERMLADLFAEILGIERVGVEDSLFELGADSLTAVQILVEIESRFAAELSLLSLFEAPTIANLARQLELRETSDPFAPLIPLRRAGDRRPVFCVHSVVGVAWSFAGLLRHIGPHTPLYGLQARGLSEAGADLPRSIDDMAADYAALIRSVQPEGPYRLIGWSLGGLTAHAIAARLESEGETVEMLALLDAFPFNIGGAKNEESAVVEAALQFLGLDSAPSGGKPATLDMLGDSLIDKFDVFSAPIIARAGFDAGALRGNFLRVIKNAVAISLAHQPGAVAAPIKVYRAAADDDAVASPLARRQKGVWAEYAFGAVEEVDIDCRHFAMLNAEPLEEIGPRIRTLLDALDGGA